MSFTSLVRFIPFFFFLTILNEIIFKLSVCDFIVSVKKCSRFLYIELCPIILLNSFFLIVFVWNLQGFLYRLLYHPHTVTALLLPFQFGYVFLFLSDGCG